MRSLSRQPKAHRGIPAESHQKKFGGIGRLSSFILDLFCAKKPFKLPSFRWDEKFIPTAKGASGNPSGITPTEIWWHWEAFIVHFRPLFLQKSPSSCRASAGMRSLSRQPKAHRGIPAESHQKKFGGIGRLLSFILDLKTDANVRALIRGSVNLSFQIFSESQSAPYVL